MRFSDPTNSCSSITYKIISLIFLDSRAFDTNTYNASAASERRSLLYMLINILKY